MARPSEAPVRPILVEGQSNRTPTPEGQMALAPVTEGAAGDMEILAEQDVVSSEAGALDLTTRQQSKAGVASQRVMVSIQPALEPGLDSTSYAMTMPGSQPTMLEEPQILDLSVKWKSSMGRLHHKASMHQPENLLNNIWEEIPQTVAAAEEATSPTLEYTALGPGLDSASSAVTMPGPQPTILGEPQILDLSLKAKFTRGRSQHKGFMPQLADRVEEKEGRIYRTPPECVEVRKKSGCDGDGTQKQNQIGQTRDMLHQHQKEVIFQEEMGTVTNKRLNNLQSSDFAPSNPLRKSSVKCRTGHTDGKPHQPLQCGESSGWSPKDRRVHTGERSDMSLKSEKCFSLGSATEISQPLISDRKPYKSTESERSFKRTFEPEIHQRTHKGKKVYECVECGKGFKRKSHLRQHQRIHTGEKPYTCNECGKCFRHHFSFRNHQNTHSGKKPYHCEECGKTFSDRSNFVRHKRIHSGEKPYACKKCGKHFTRLSSLNAHQQTRSGKKPYNCDECGKAFSYRRNLVRHKQIHLGEKPYSCQDCGKCFSDPSTLRTHKRIHTAEKHFQCKECEKTFSRRCNLVAHQRSHSREKPVSS